MIANMAFFLLFFFMIMLFLIGIHNYYINIPENKKRRKPTRSKNDEMDCRTCLHQTYQPLGRERCSLVSIEYPYMKVGGCKRYQTKPKQRIIYEKID